MSIWDEKQPLIKTDKDNKRRYFRTVKQDVSIKNIIKYDTSLPLKRNNNNSSIIKICRSKNYCPITYTWSDINVYYTMKSSNLWNRFFNKNEKLIYEKHVLKNVSGIAYPGELLVILGPSGAGKTSLLNVLAFQCDNEVEVSGNITINGRRVNSSILKSQLAYIQQKDLFIGTLTVKEHLIFQALIRMDKDIPYQQRIERVNEVISELTLTNCQNTIIGISGRLKGISGGEIKRLSFASEVLTDPALMICDEPTSGLDSYTALQVISVLKKLADKQKTIVTTLHQPSFELYNLFDKILLIAEGRVAFTGTSEEALNFFTSIGNLCPLNYNPADFFIQILAIVPGKEITCKYIINSVCDKYANSNIGKNILLEIKRITVFQEDANKEKMYILNNNYQYKADWIQQFRALLWRSWISVIKEPILIKVRLLQTVIVSILIGIIYFNQNLDQDGVININGVLFIFLTNMTFQNIFAVINVFCSELPIFLREHKSGIYRADVYFLSKTIAEAPIFIVVPLVFTIIAYPMIGLFMSIQHFFIAAGIIVLVANVSTSFGYLISCISKNLTMALSIGPPIIIPFLLFGGFFFNSGSIPVYFKWFSYLSWFRYGNEALLINQWSDIDLIVCTKNNITCPGSGHVILQALNFKMDNFWFDVAALFMLIIIFRLLAFLALISKIHTKNKYV